MGNRFLPVESRSRADWTNYFSGQRVYAVARSGYSNAGSGKGYLSNEEVVLTFKKENLKLQLFGRCMILRFTYSLRVFWRMVNWNLFLM